MTLYKTRVANAHEAFHKICDDMETYYKTCGSQSWNDIYKIAKIIAKLYCLTVIPKSHQYKYDGMEWFK